jgi:hypothetical protein
MTKNFEIGQVVYILSEQAQTILPGIVAEEVVIKKLSGNSTSWKVKVGHGDRAKLFDSSKIRGEVYGSLDEVREIMSQRLNEYVNKITVEAQERVEKWYGKEIADREKQMFQNTALNSPAAIDDRIDPDILLSSLENVPTSNSPKFTPEAKIDPRASLRQNLTALAIPDEEEEVSGEGTMFITGPNGEKIPVRMQKPKAS